MGAAAGIRGGGGAAGRRELRPSGPGSERARERGSEGARVRASQCARVRPCAALLCPGRACERERERERERGVVQAGLLLTPAAGLCVPLGDVITAEQPRRRRPHLHKAPPPAPDTGWGRAKTLPRHPPRPPPPASPPTAPHCVALRCKCTARWGAPEGGAWWSRPGGCREKWGYSHPGGRECTFPPQRACARGAAGKQAAVRSVQDACGWPLPASASFRPAAGPGAR